MAYLTTSAPYCSLCISALFATSCVVEPATRVAEESTNAAEAQLVEVEPIEDTDGVDDTRDGWMSSTCSPPLTSDQLWQTIDSGTHDLYVLSGLEVVGDQEVQERSTMGLLESRALQVSLKGADLVVNITGTHPDHSLLFLEESRVFHSAGGGVFRARGCSTARSVEDGGSLSSRVMAGSGRTVLLLVQPTSQLGPVVRQVALVVGGSVRLADDEEVPLQLVVEAGASVRLARAQTEEQKGTE